jgi:hypothetical protein
MWIVSSAYFGARMAQRVSCAGRLLGVENMGPTSRDGEAEIKRACAILKQELPKELQAKLISPPSPGQATWVNHRYEMGVRGVGLDYSVVDWDTLEGESSSSSCCMDEGKIVADGEGSKVILDLPVVPCGKWATDFDAPDWPHRSCVRIAKLSESVLYFDVPVGLERQQVELLAFCVEHAQRLPFPVPDHEIFSSVSCNPGTDLAPLFSRIRRAFRAAAQSNPNPEIRDAACKLADVLLPSKKPSIGYRIGRVELFRFI